MAWHNRLENEGFDVDTARQIDNQRTECLAKLLLKALVEGPHVLLALEEEARRRGTLRLNQTAVQHIQFQNIDRILWIQSFGQQFLLRLLFESAHEAIECLAIDNGFTRKWLNHRHTARSFVNMHNIHDG